jgi:hypothetical protein
MRIYNRQPEPQTKSAFLKFVPPLYPKEFSAPPPEPTSQQELARLLLQDQPDEPDKPALEKSGARK